MIIKVLLNENNYVIAYATIGDMAGSIKANLLDESLAHFESNFKSYYCINSTLFFDELKDTINKKDEEKMQLRILRERLCFPIVNRGRLWYEFLSEEQVNELKAWYHAWLDVTETLSMPETPQWLISI